MKLSFHPYIERPKRSLHASWASILVRPAPGFRGGVEVDLAWAPARCGRPSCSSSTPRPFPIPCWSSPRFLSTSTSLGSNLFLFSQLEEQRNEFTCYFS